MTQFQKTPYGSVANIYDGFLTLTGFKRGVESFFDRVDFKLPNNAKILDAGCGTGLLTIYLARRFPTARIVATDVDEKMLGELTRLRNDAGFTPEHIAIGVSDLTTPAEMTPLGGRTTIAIPELSLDAVMVSGALEHVALDETIKRLVKLLKPGGLFFNLGVRKNPAVAVLGMVYHFRPYSIAELRRACARAGLDDIRAIPLRVEDFPANLSRVGVIARKPS